MAVVNLEFVGIKDENDIDSKQELIDSDDDVIVISEIKKERLKYDADIIFFKEEDEHSNHSTQSMPLDLSTSSLSLDVMKEEGLFECNDNPLFDTYVPETTANFENRIEGVLPDFTNCSYKNKLTTAVNSSVVHTDNKTTGSDKVQHSDVTTDRCSYNYHDHSYAYACNICEHTSKCSNSLRHHIQTKHIQKAYSCTRCEYKTCYKSHLNKHIQVQHVYEFAFSYTCLFCEYKTSNMPLLTQHMQSEHCVPLIYECRSCAFTSNNNTTFEAHMHTQEHIDADNTLITLYRCGGCNYSSLIKQETDCHVISEHYPAIDMCCTICEYKCVSKETMKRHIRSLHPDIYLACDECEYTCTNISRLNRHKSVKHSGIQYKCDLCLFTCRYPHHLKRHVEAMHEGITYKCESCEYISKWKTTLNKHISRNHMPTTD